MFVVWCVLFVFVYRFLVCVVVCCLSSVDCWLLFGVCCLLIVASCSLSVFVVGTVVGSLLFGVCCCVYVCRLWFVVCSFVRSVV